MPSSIILLGYQDKSKKGHFSAIYTILKRCKYYLLGKWQQSFHWGRLQNTGKEEKIEKRCIGKMEKMILSTKYCISVILIEVFECPHREKNQMITPSK